MRSRLVFTVVFAGLVFASGAAAEYDYYKHLRYPKGLVPGIGRNKVAQIGGAEAVGYKRRTVQWWPRKGQDIVDIPAGAPLRTWTRNNGKKDPAALAGLGQNWSASDSETFEAHLVALRGFGTSTDIPGNLHSYTPMAVLRMPDGRQRVVTDSGPLCRMVSAEDGKFIHSIWEKAYPRLHAGLNHDDHLTQKKSPPGGIYVDMPLKPWTQGAPRFNAMEPAKDAKYPRWGQKDGTTVFETRHFHIIANIKRLGNPRKWINPKDLKAQNLYRKCVMEFAENLWTYVEAAGASMPYWRLAGDKYKYVVFVKDSGHGGSGGWMHCTGES